MNIDLLKRKCRKCLITLSEFEVTEKNSLCIDCYKEEHGTVESKVEKPKRLKNKRITFLA